MLWLLQHVSRLHKCVCWKYLGKVPRDPKVNLVWIQSESDVIKFSQWTGLWEPYLIRLWELVRQLVKVKTVQKIQRGEGVVFKAAKGIGCWNNAMPVMMPPYARQHCCRAQCNLSCVSCPSACFESLLWHLGAITKGTQGYGDTNIANGDSWSKNQDGYLSQLTGGGMAGRVWDFTMLQSGVQTYSLLLGFSISCLGPWLTTGNRNNENISHSWEHAYGRYLKPRFEKEAQLCAWFIFSARIDLCLNSYGVF